MDSVKLYAGYGGMIDLENDKLVHDRGKFVRSSDYEALRARLGEVEAERDALRHDIERYVAICSEQANELHRLELLSPARGDGDAKRRRKELASEIVERLWGMAANAFDRRIAVEALLEINGYPSATPTPPSAEGDEGFRAKADDLYYMIRNHQYGLRGFGDGALSRGRNLKDDERNTIEKALKLAAAPVSTERMVEALTNIKQRHCTSPDKYDSACNCCQHHWHAIDKALSPQPQEDSNG